MLVSVLLGQVLGNQPLAVFLRLLSGVYIGHQPLAVIRIIRVVSNGRRVIGGSEPWRGDW